MCNEIAMTRTYTLKRRAEQQAETRRRIVEAAVELHGSVGPARDHLQHGGGAGRRAAAHALCPLPRRASLLPGLLRAWRWSATRCPTPRRGGPSPTGASGCAAGLRAIYAWYERNAELLACVLRDAEHHRADARDRELRFGRRCAAWREVLGATLSAKQRAMLRLALSFHTWRTLARDGGLTQDAAVAAMVEAVGSKSALRAAAAAAIEQSGRR